MDRSAVRILMLAALCLPGAAAAQQSLPTEPPPNPHEVIFDQRLENADQRLLTAGEELRRAADAADQDRTRKALSYSRETLGAVRAVFDDLPPARRTPYDEAFAQAEQALQTGDPNVGAEAFKALQEKIRELVQRGT
jgi:hypothetical protein